MSIQPRSAVGMSEKAEIFHRLTMTSFHEIFWGYPCQASFNAG